MRYTDIICSVCNKPFTENDDVVVCPVCGTPHHRTCWAREGHCANEALHEQGFAWQFPEDKDPLKQLDEQKKKAHSPAPDFSFKNGEKVVECPRCGALNYENDAFCMKCHAPLKERQNPTDPPQGAAWQQNNAPQGYDQADPHRLAYDNQRLYGGLDPNTLCGSGLRSGHGTLPRKTRRPRQGLPRRALPRPGKNRTRRCRIRKRRAKGRN